MCLPCNSKCANCAPDVNTCTECEVSQFRILASPNCICKDGYFEDAAASDVCLVCSNLCLKCVGNKDDCLECNPAHSRTLNAGGTKRCDCNEGFYHAGIPMC